jgi:ParB family chromosome partitioning protein
MVAQKQLSVRQTEALVKRLTTAPERPPVNVKTDPNISSLERSLCDQLGAAVSIQHGSKGGGKLIIKYSSPEELDGILGHIK